MSATRDGGDVRSIPLDRRGLPRAGFEMELLAPVGASRLELAELLARRSGGAVRRAFHVDTEASSTPGVSQFWNLTPAFEVRDSGGGLLCTLVDDTTIVDDLDPKAPARSGWFRILSDDARLLRLVQRHTDPAEGIGSVLDAAARLFGQAPRRVGDVYRLDDSAGATIAIAAPLPGERERPCEVITPAYDNGHLRRLTALLRPAQTAGFTVPVEAAVHIHLDAEPFRDVAVFRHVVRLFGAQRTQLQRLFATNPNCRRLAPLPPALVELVEKDWPNWHELRQAAAELQLTKYSDVNLTRVLGMRPGPDTLEVRMLPGSIDAEAIYRQFCQVVELLDPS